MKSFLHNILVYVYVFVFVYVFVPTSCSRPSTPKPYGYFRIAMPQPHYVAGSTPHARFCLNAAAQITGADPVHTEFFNIYYPDLNATIHCTYVPIQDNLPALLVDAQQMVYSHTMKASAIPEQEYMDAEHRVYGMFYELKGNTATPAQFYLTDSTRHFFRASVYINAVPNQDSLAPVIQYLVADTREMIETFRWQ